MKKDKFGKNQLPPGLTRLVVPASQVEADIRGVADFFLDRQIHKISSPRASYFSQCAIQSL